MLYRGMKIDLTSTGVQGWLDQFEGNDRSVGELLLKSVLVVSADEFQGGLTELVKNRIGEVKHPIALYAEYDIREWMGQPNRLFPEKGRKRRAHGSTTNMVVAQRAAAPQIGSEGIVGNLITQLVRQPKLNVFSHPGADVFRKKKIRKFILVTDFIGSGEQSERFLHAAWRVASVKSWKSGKFVEFEVVCYSGTIKGIERLQAHPSAPKIFQVVACPTVSKMEHDDRFQIGSLLSKYGPKDSETEIPRLGYDETGALIAFSHGIPNNAPRLLFKSGKDWMPIFLGRVTRIQELKLIVNKQKLIADALSALHENKLASQASKQSKSSTDFLVAIVIVALKRKPRNVEVVSARTNLSISECESVIDRLGKAGFLDANLKPTAIAYEQLKYLRKPNEEIKNLTFPGKTSYVPTQLRAPRERFR